MSAPSVPTFGGVAQQPPSAPTSAANSSAPVFGGVAQSSVPQFGGAAPAPVFGTLNGSVAGTVNGSVPVFGGTAQGDAEKAVDLDQALAHLPRAKQYPMPEVDGRFNPSFGRWGHYNLPDVTGGNSYAYYPRVTTIGKALEDSEFLDKWKTGRLLEGVAKHREILDLIDLEGIAAGTREARDMVDALAERARESVGAGNAGKFGDAVHAWSEYVDLGQGTVEDVPMELRAHVAAYIAACRGAGIRAIPEYVERIIYSPYTGAAGRVDRISQLPDGTLVVVDVKTTKNLSAGLLAISVQLAQYATATHMLSQDGTHWEEMPKGISQELAIVAHIPSDMEGDAVYCDMVDIDLTYGIENMRRAAEVRDSRSAKKYISKGKRLRALSGDYQHGMSVPPPLVPVPVAAPVVTAPAVVQPEGMPFAMSQRDTIPVPSVPKYSEMDAEVAKMIGKTTSLDELRGVFDNYNSYAARHPEVGPWKAEYTEWGKKHAAAKGLV